MVKGLRKAIKTLFEECNLTEVEIDFYEELALEMKDCVNKGQFVITFWNDGENKGVEVFQNMDEVIKYVGEDLESAYHWVMQDWIDRKYKYAWSELILMLTKSMHDFFEENDGKKYHVHTYRRYADRIEIE